MTLYELESTIELPMVEWSCGDSRIYRLELFRRVQEPRTYRVRVYHSDSYNLTPTFCSEAYKGLPATVSIFVKDASHKWDELRGDHPDELIEAVISLLESLVREGGGEFRAEE